MKYNNILFFIIFIIIIIFLIYRYFFFFKKKQEHFYTYFNPFTSNINNKFDLLYNTKYYRTNYYKKKYIFKYLTFAMASTDIYISYKKTKENGLTFFSYLTSILLMDSNIINIQTLNYKKINNLIIDINRNLINFGLVSAPILAEVMLDYSESNTSLFKGTNLRFLFNTNKQYLLIVTKKINNISSVRDVTNKYKIGIDYIGSSDYKITKQILNAFNKIENVDYILSYYNDNYNLLNNLTIGNADIIFMTISFPSKSLTEYLDLNFTKNFMILSLDDLNFKKFFNQFYYYQKAYIDLNKVSDIYLPVKINNRVYSRFNPYLLTISYFNIFVTNKFIDKKIVKEITTVFFNNIPKFNKLIEFKENKLMKNSCASLNNVQLLLHPGAEEFYINRGYITYTNNPNCKYFIGRMPCNKETLITHNLLY